MLARYAYIQPSEWKEMEPQESAALLEPVLELLKTDREIAMKTSMGA